MIEPDDPVGNLQRIAQRNYREALARLGQPVDPTDWGIAPQWPGAVLTFHQNAYNFAAALLQPPKFDPSAPDAANYGAIGAIVGHEVSHFVDTLGAEYEADGRLRRWWTDDDMSRYAAASEALVRQFASYRPFPDVARRWQAGIDGKRCRPGRPGCGLRCLPSHLGQQASDKEYVREQDRQFFIGFGEAGAPSTATTR